MTTRRLREWWMDREYLGGAIDYILDSPEILSDWEIGFLKTIRRYRRTPSEEQIDIFFRVLELKGSYDRARFSEDPPPRPALRIVGGTDYEARASR
jgi:hypothetical protein